MKKGILIALLIYSSQLYGYQECNSTFAFVDALVWKLREASAESWAQEISPAGVNQTINIVGVPFNWKGGLRVGIGRDLAYDRWDTVFSYTFYQSTANSQASIAPGAVSSPFAANFYANNTNGASITLDPTYRSASMKWNFKFNVFDLELGRKFRINELLLLRPFIGIKGAIINQHMDTVWHNPTNAINFTSATENLKNNFYGFGPAVGLNSKWNVYKSVRRRFDIIADFSGALMWGHWRFKDQYANDRPTAISINVSSINGAAAMTRGLLGVEWLAIFGKTNVNMRIGYEAQVWFDQAQFYSYSMGRVNTLLSLQGAVVGFGVNF